MADFINRIRTGDQTGKKEDEESGRVPVRIHNISESDLINLGKGLLNAILIFLLTGQDDPIQFPQLCEAQGPLDFHHAIVEAEKISLFKSSPHIGIVIVAMVVVLGCLYKEIVVIGNNHSTFSRRHGFH